MNAYPIIHARTFFSDFPTGLLICPAVFNSHDVEASRKYILSATKEINNLSGIRRIIFTVGDYSVFGIVGFIKDMYKKNKAADKYSRDSFSRRLYAFIGYAIAREELSEYNIPLIIPEEMLKLYINKMSDNAIWKSETPTTFMSEAIKNIPTKKVSISNKNVKKKYFSCSEETDTELFEKCAMLCKNDTGLCLCTNFCDATTNSVFKIISIKENGIDEEICDYIAGNEVNSNIDKMTTSIKSAITVIAGILTAILMIGSKIYSLIKKK